MSIDLYLAPAGYGKSSFICKQLMDAVGDLARVPLVCVPTAWQARAWRRRLARKNAIGVRVVTFTELYQSCLDRAGDACAVLPETVQHALLQNTVNRLAEDGQLRSYHTLRDKPGFIKKAQGLINELKTARITPAQFLESAASERLHDLAQIYQAYDEILAGYEDGHPPLTDAAGLAERALIHLEDGSGYIPHWSLIAFDGFDVLTTLRVAFVRALGARYRVLITLTGPADGNYKREVHARFQETYERLQHELAEEEWRQHALPHLDPPDKTAVTHLEMALFQPEVSTCPASETVTCLVAPDRAGEIWRAMRWIKERVVHDNVPLAEIALIAREIDPYHALIRETAAATGIPIRFENGLPLSQNPAVEALLQLLRLFRPRTAEEPGQALARLGVVEAWRSPYFDWTNALGIALEADHAEALEAAAFLGRVKGGREEWERALRFLSREREPRAVPNVGAAAEQLWERWELFMRYMDWAEGKHPIVHFVSHLERMIGNERQPSAGSLNIAVCARDYDAAAGENTAALRALKDVLRGMLWSALTTTAAPLTYAVFVDELEAAIEDATYDPPAASPALTIARVFDVRGVPLQAVAVLGLAEGEFPPTGNQDALLDDAERAVLNERLPQRMPFRLRLEQDERPLFYDTVTRPRQKILLTRPHRAEDGSEWPASAYWEEVERLLENVQTDKTDDWSERVDLPPVEASLIAIEEGGSIRAEGQRGEDLIQAADIFRHRYGGQKGPYDGDGSFLASQFDMTYGPDYLWSPSQLERYTMCPHYFFVERTLGLRRIEEPEDDPLPYHLGNIYHRIFQKLFEPGVHSQLSPCTAPVEPLDFRALQKRADSVADEVLDGAPIRFGFRPPPWWPAIRQRVKADVQRSLPRLVKSTGPYYPVAVEFYFETRIEPADGGESFHLRGYIDRIDRDPTDGIRVIDYKLGAPSSHNKKALEKGKKIQLPLYARAVQNICALDKPPDGFYWHVRHAEQSDTLSDYGDAGEAEAVQTALAFVSRVVDGVRQGLFQPQPPDDGCPSYCPAVTFCWHYSPRFGGQ